MSKPSVSFIIPYYHVALPLLARALDSVIRLGEQADWEVRVIDDGTPGHEAENYIRQLHDPRIHYHWQENKGLSEARNAGIAWAQKEYIQFLDADDYLFPTPMNRIISLLEERPETELLAFRLLTVSDIAPHDLPASPFRIQFQGNGTEFMTRHSLRGSACGYVFRRKTLGGLKFTAGVYHEDEEFTPLLFLRTRHIIVTDLPAYAYYQRPDSILHRKDPDFVEKRFLDCIEIIHRLQRLSGQLPEIQARALEARVRQLCMATVYSLLWDSPDVSFLRKMLRLLRQEHFYPLRVQGYSLPYLIVSVLCFCTASTVLLYRGLHLLLPLLSHRAFSPQRTFPQPKKT